MDDFVLDSKLDTDCITIAEWEDCLLLLMNNALAPWFILVPKTDVIELFQLPGVVWGRSETEPYQPDAISRICQMVTEKLQLVG